MTLVQLSERSGVSAVTVSCFDRGVTASRVLARRAGGLTVASTTGRSSSSTMESHVRSASGTQIICVPRSLRR